MEKIKELTFQNWTPIEYVVQMAACLSCAITELPSNQKER